jgi:hypothetical protein
MTKKLIYLPRTVRGAIPVWKCAGGGQSNWNKKIKNKE